jgi:Protein of unknown function (DUF3352)
MNIPRPYAHLSPLLFFTFYFLLFTSRASAGTPTNDLLRLVPQDMGFSLVVQDLRGNAERFLGSPFVEHFVRSPLGQSLRNAPEAQKLAQARSFLEGVLGVDWPRIRDEILGDAIVAAYRPGPPIGTEEAGLFLVRARSADLLAQLIQRLNDVQKESGDLKDLVACKHQGTSYFCRVESKGKTFYYLHGAVLAFSPQEPAIQQVIDLDLRPPTAVMSPLETALEREDAKELLALLWINPRVFEPEIERSCKQAQGAEAAVRTAVLSYWKALEGASLQVSFRESDLQLKLTFRIREERLPAAARKLVERGAQPSELWQRFPQQALLTVAGRFDPKAWDDFVTSLLNESDRQALHKAVDRGAGAALGKDVGRDVIPYLGPDWGFCIAPAPAAEKAWFPQMTWALRVRQGDQQPSVDRVLLNGLNTLATLAVFAYNTSHDDRLTLRVVFDGPVEVRHLTGDKAFPPGLQPAFGYKDGYLLVASSPEAIRSFGKSASSLPVGTSSREVPLLRLSFAALRQFLKERQEALTPYLAEKGHLTPSEVSRRIQKLIDGIGLFDRVDLTHYSADNQHSLILHVRTTQPLQK